MNNHIPEQTHLNDAELISVLYGEASTDSVSHCDACNECRQRLEDARSARESLIDFDVPTPEFNAAEMADAALFTSKPTPRKTAQTQSEQMGTHRQTTSNAVWISTAILIFALGFFVGGWMPASIMGQPSQPTVSERDARLHEKVEQLEKSLAKFTQSNNKPAELDSLKSQLQQLNSSLAKIDTSNSRSAKFFRYLENKMSKMQRDQGVLRKDIQTMAINAEKEINLTRNDVQRLTEVVEYLLPVLH